MKTVEKIEKNGPVIPRRKKVAAYARVSFDSTRMQHSLSAQVSYYSDLIQSNPEWEYAGVYADYGISGTGTQRRAEFNRMLANCEEGKIDIILTKSIQRFARNTVDLLNTVRHLKELGIEVRFEKENISSMSGDGELMLSILASFAQEESRSISENCKWSIRKRFQSGEIGVANKHILGYRYDDSLHRYVIIPEEAVIVRRMFRLYLEGKSLQAICDDLNGAGYRTINGCLFQEASLAALLNNEIYAGDLLRQKSYIADPISKSKVKNKGELPKYYLQDAHEAMYSTLVNGGFPEEIADVLTELAIPTGGRRRDGTLNTHWTANGVIAVMRNEKHCGDVLARKTYTPNYKDHKTKKNNGKKNKYFQPDHHDAIVSRTMWNAAQRILNSRKYGHEGTYLPMRIIDRGALIGYISMNRSWAGFDYEDYYRASQIAMGMLDEELEMDLGSEYLPEGGRRIGGLVDDHGIAQIARDLTAAERQIKDELEGISADENEKQNMEDAASAFQVVSGDMFSRVHEPVVRITTKGITFSKSCVSKLAGTETVELLFNPVERMMVVRPCGTDHPNAITWDPKYKGAAPLSKVLYDSMGWEPDYSFRVPCQKVSSPKTAMPGGAVLVFDLDNYIGRAASRKDEAIVARKEAEPMPEEREDAKSYYYPPDEDEPREIRDMEEKFRQAVEMNKKVFGPPAFQHDSCVRGLGADCGGETWDMMIEARPLDISHTVDAGTVDSLMQEIIEDPPVLPPQPQAYPGEPIDVKPEGEEA